MLTAHRREYGWSCCRDLLLWLNMMMSRILQLERIFTSSTFCSIFSQFNDWLCRSNIISLVYAIFTYIVILLYPSYHLCWYALLMMCLIEIYLRQGPCHHCWQIPPSSVFPQFWLNFLRIKIDKIEQKMIVNTLKKNRKIKYLQFRNKIRKDVTLQYWCLHNILTKNIVIIFHNRHIWYF